jgi:hypothetical protein
MTISLHLPDIACMHSNGFAGVAAAAAIGTLLVVGCGPASQQASVPAAAGPVAPGVSLLQMRSLHLGRLPKPLLAASLSKEPNQEPTTAGLEPRPPTPSVRIRR